jgi:hypothetical protein
MIVNVRVAALRSMCSSYPFASKIADLQFDRRPRLIQIRRPDTFDITIKIEGMRMVLTH